MGRDGVPMQSRGSSTVVQRVQRLVTFCVIREFASDFAVRAKSSLDQQLEMSAWLANL
jgi:hypothetical protein